MGGRPRINGTTLAPYACMGSKFKNTRSVGGWGVIFTSPVGVTILLSLAVRKIVRESGVKRTFS